MRKGKSISVKTLFIIINIGAFILVAALGGTVLRVYSIENKLDTEQNRRYESSLLVEVLRRTGRDLNYFSKDYALTGNENSAKIHALILSIHKGEKARPMHYERFDWQGFADKDSSYAPKESVPLEALFMEAGFAEDELKIITKSFRLLDKIAGRQNTQIIRQRAQIDSFTTENRQQHALNKQLFKENIAELLAKFENRSDRLVLRLEQQTALAFYLLFALISVIILLAGTSYYVIKAKVLRPLTILEHYSARFAQGNFSENIPIHSRDEVGSLARAINRLRIGLKSKADFAGKIGRHEFDPNFKPLGENDELGHTLLKMSSELQASTLESERRAWFHEGTGKLLFIFRSDDNLERIAFEITSLMVRHLNAGVGAFYFAEKDRKMSYLRLGAVFGGVLPAESSVAYGEGPVGVCAMEQKIIHLKDIPEPKRSLKATTMRGVKLRHLLVIPLKTVHELVGVIEINSFHAFEKHQLDFAENVSERIALSIADIRADHTNKLLVNELKQSNEELLSQKEELHQNSEEIHQIAEQLQSLNDSLEDRVRDRTADLQKANVRLEKHRSELESKRNELENKNTEIERQKRETEEALNALKSAQTKLVQSEKMASLGQLTAGIAHELNNPINYVSSGIMGLKMVLEDFRTLIALYNEINAQNFEDKLAEIEEFKEEIEFEELLEGIGELTGNITTGAERAAEIVRGLRTFSRLDESSLKLVDLHENIDSTLAMLRSQYKNHIEIKKEYGPIPRIECHPGKLNQVFMNMLINAVHAIDGKDRQENESITIRTSLFLEGIRQFVRIEFQDTGAGIPAKLREHIFEPFFTSKDVGKGTGLGLPISLSIIEGHYGRIDFTSRENEGTNFIISLPVLQEKETMSHE